MGEKEVWKGKEKGGKIKEGRKSRNNEKVSSKR
jgi:hypothetical protein